MSTEVKDYKLCYVEHLLQSQGCCHLCMIVLSSLPEESKSKPMAMVILSAVPMDDYGIDSFPLRVQIGETESEYCKWEAFASPFLFLRTHNSLSRPSSCTKLTDRGVAGQEDMFDAPKLVHNLRIKWQVSNENYPDYLGRCEAVPGWKSSKMPYHLTSFHETSEKRFASSVI
ncbi:hypothetical protein SNOG_07470 [Parastagonospora nodorum SN15]|uniref:Uncharacterized protein n=1 Tax=Phaeosphaeria nodorum (strain SN15 / ATCC MYA-4574 / FGSC 10173) TaxID=321614 RepID=Q0UL94_PHANO|nr:hypothetical protein SNOG_07470 [Parastagonospora nodorum SN15]EAT84936.1 hypothetical protein SNOG_07470 [Parastagonospora nodorum SN15]